MEGKPQTFRLSPIVTYRTEQKKRIHNFKRADQKDRSNEAQMQKIRKRETSPNPEYSIKYKVMIRAHQDNVFEQLKLRVRDMSADNIQNADLDQSV